MGCASAVLVGAVVVMVSMAVPAAVPVMLTGLVAPKLSVGGFWAPAGPVTTADSVTLPVKPPLGVTVIVEVLPVVAPALTDTAVPATVKLGVVEDVTVTELVPVAALYMPLPEYVAVSVSEPTASDPAGTLMVALPLLRAMAPEL